MKTSPRILIIGAGPTGLGAAWRLAELNHNNWLLFEGTASPGGLASSVTDPHGYTWDLGGHVLFSHYAYFDKLMDDLLKDGWVEHVRESWVWMRDRFIPYPLQNNIWRLPADDLVTCLKGLLKIHKAPGSNHKPRTFQDWIDSNFGEGIAQVFMNPYNYKVWAYRPERLGAGWMGERVATIDLGRILENLVRQRDDCAWGPNHTFKFPLRGGTGSIWKSLCERLPKNQVCFNSRVSSINPEARKLKLAGGSEHEYDFIISSMPLDHLLRCFPEETPLHAFADRLVFSKTHVVGVGLKGKVPEPLKTKNWVYFPEPDVPFYRVTVFSNYSPHNVPCPGENWSLLCEVSESEDKPLRSENVIDDVITGLNRCGFLSGQAEIASRWHRRLERGYPTPFVGRDEILPLIDKELRDLKIWSRGRFGAWKYEVSNQDHSLMQGVEAVDHILSGREELTYCQSEMVNSRKN
jgi:protoporphyrinogen oxidase